jgi:hypothetical protein
MVIPEQAAVAASCLSLRRDQDEIVDQRSGHDLVEWILGMRHMQTTCPCRNSSRTIWQGGRRPWIMLSSVLVLRAAELCDLDYPTPVWRALHKRKVGTSRSTIQPCRQGPLDVNNIKHYWFSGRDNVRVCQ